MKHRFYLFGPAFAAVFLYQTGPISASGAGPGSSHKERHQRPDTVVQIAPLDQLSRGGFDGTTTVQQVRKMADFGIGTFNGLDGEMIMLDGVMYQAPSNGVLRIATPGELIPFATLTTFRAERFFRSTGPLADYPALQTFLSSTMPDQNQILAVKVQGTFETLKLRAPLKQVKPYPTLNEALKTQAVFELAHVRGILVGFRFPPYFGAVNAAGYHFHFVSEDGRIGGHVIEVSSGSVVVVGVETIEQYHLTLVPAG